MKRCFVASIILLALCIALCGCDMSLKSQPVSASQDICFYVYVCGAVENEGYYVFKQGADYNSAVAAAGINDHTAFPAFGTDLITERMSVLTVNYIENSKEFPCVDVNGLFVTYGLPIENVEDTVLRKLTEYVNQNGKITDKSQLKHILGDDYQNNYYKFYVSENDYEKTD